MGRRGPAQQGNHEAAACGGSSAERWGSLQVPDRLWSFIGRLQIQITALRPEKKKKRKRKKASKKERKRKSPMSNPDRTQHALFFEIGRVSGKARQERISMKNSAWLSASPSLSSPPLPYLREDKSNGFASIAFAAVPPALRPQDASLSETALWVVSLLALY